MVKNSLFFALGFFSFSLGACPGKNHKHAHHKHHQEDAQVVDGHVMPMRAVDATALSESDHKAFMKAFEYAVFYVVEFLSQEGYQAYIFTEDHEVIQSVDRFLRTASVAQVHEFFSFLVDDIYKNVINNPEIQLLQADQQAVLSESAQKLLVEGVGIMHKTVYPSDLQSAALFKQVMSFFFARATSEELAMRFAFFIEHVEKQIKKLEVV